MKKRISYILVLMLVFSITGINYAYAKEEVGITRICGEDRYETSLEVYKHVKEKSNSLIIASGEVFPDALVFGSLSMKNDIPILLVEKNSISNSTMKEIKNSKIDEIIIAGGINTISKDVEEELRGIAKTVRISGKNRYETNIKLNEYLENLNGKMQINAVTSGENFADALVAAPYIYKNGYLLLTDNTYIYDNVNLVFGGFNSVSGYKEIKRFGGLDRYETSKLIADEMEFDKVVIVGGENFPDALTSSIIAKQYDAPIILTKLDEIPSAIEDLLKNRDIKEAIIVGGTNSVGEKVENRLRELLNKEEEIPGEIKIDKTGLKNKIIEAEKLDKEDYTAESYNALEEALSSANKVLKDEAATREEVDQVESLLKKAIEGLKEKPVKEEVDKTSLKNKIIEAEKLDKEDYTAESYKVLEEALSSANKILKDEAVTREEVDEVESLLKKAIDSLKEISKDITEYFTYLPIGENYKITGLSEKGKSYFKETKKLILPSEYQGKKITEIDQYAFQGETFTEVKLSEFIEKIGFKGFLKNPIQNLILNEGLKVIDRYAFSQRGLEGGNLESIVLPSTLVEINSGAFDSTNISEVNVPNSLSKLDPYAFDSSKGNKITGKVHIFTPNYKNENNLQDSIYHIIDPAEIVITYTNPDGEEIKKVSLFGDSKSYYHIGEEISVKLESPDNRYSLEKDSLTIIPSEKITNISVKLIDRSTEKVLKSITYPRNVEVDKGTSILDVMELLPKEVKLTDSQENEYTVDVKWSSIVNYDANQPGNYKTYSKIALPDGVKANPDISLDISIDIIINEDALEKYTISIVFDKGDSNATGLIVMDDKGKKFPMIKKTDEYSAEVPNGNYNIIAENLKDGYILVGKQKIEVNNKNETLILQAVKGIVLNIKSIDDTGQELKNVSYKTIYTMQDYNTWKEEETQYELIIPNPEEWDPTKISLDLIEVPEGYKVKTEMPVDITESYDKKITIEFEKLSDNIIEIELDGQSLIIKPSVDIKNGNFIITDSTGTKVYIGSFSSSNKNSLKIDLSNNKPGDYNLKANVNNINIEKTFKLSNAQSKENR